MDPRILEFLAANDLPAEAILGFNPLQLVWFGLIAVLFAGYFFLEGFDYGAGIVMPFAGKTNDERRLVHNALGPIWDGNEVWLLTAGGAVFAAFPHWYASMFSGLYLALFLMLVALILRIVAFEFRSKRQDPVWQKRWDMCLAGGSALVTILWGAAVTNLVTGVPIDFGSIQYGGTFWHLVEPWDILGGLCFLALFSYYGCLFLDVKTDDKALQVRIKNYAPRLFVAMLIMLLVWLALMFFMSNMFVDRLGVFGGGLKLLPLGLIAVAAVSLLLSIFFFMKGRSLLAFFCTGAGIVLFTFAVFAGMFPYVLMSNTVPGWGLTVAIASSSQTTLKLMTIVAVCLVPIVLLYQGWTYWVFRKRITVEDLKTSEY
jgi:cytochrome d ubiquinol oxidase subunit II